MKTKPNFNRVARELFGPESLGGTPTDTLEFFDNSGANLDNSNIQNDSKTDFNAENGPSGAHISGSQEWEIVRRTTSDSSAMTRLNSGTSNLVVGFLEVLSEGSDFLKFLLVGIFFAETIKNNFIL